MKQTERKQNGIKISARREFIEQNRLRINFERRLRRQMLKVFNDIGKRAEQEYQTTQQTVGLERFATQETTEVLQGHYRSVIDQFGLRILQNRKQESQFEILIRQFMQTIGFTRITNITNTTMRLIRNTILNAEADGLGVRAIARQVRDNMAGSFSLYRSAVIARTETHTAASYANNQVNASLGIPNQMKRWVSSNDNRTREWHRAMNGTMVALDEDFVVPHKGINYRMSYTGDPKGGAANVINCRCVTLYVTPEDEIID
ncbi:phage minor head protein [Marinobacter sp.]|jgi:SPP1 gp7 family putative phage head morphogenesis protein|uniref:phage minor head protein n=1 Tax=Marinobacter sp. TaxID=50741 RepID=UPI000C983C61|nr:phage minor head protein [Marinobacter sp.]MAK49792.1 hypothetical protein [Marinobacter sp.]